jgi:hypothetical protein
MHGAGGTPTVVPSEYSANMGVQGDMIKLPVAFSAGMLQEREVVLNVIPEYELTTAIRESRAHGTYLSAYVVVSEGNVLGGIF